RFLNQRPHIEPIVLSLSGALQHTKALEKLSNWLGVRAKSWILSENSMKAIKTIGRKLSHLLTVSRSATSDRCHKLRLQKPLPPPRPSFSQVSQSKRSGKSPLKPRHAERLSLLTT